MSDLACWRLGDDKYVVRCHGSEHLITYAEVDELINHLSTVLTGESQQSMGKDYTIMAEANRRKRLNQPSEAFTIIAKALGITVPPPQKPLRRI
jgi:hypothetical protein